MVVEVSSPKSDRDGRITRAGLLGVLAFSPLAFGAVHTWAYGICWGVVWALMSIWLASMWMDLYRSNGPVEPKVIRAPFLWFLLAYGLLVLVQWLPLPREWVGGIQPATLEAYREMVVMGGEVPKAIPLSLYPHATMVWFLQLWTMGAILLLSLYHLHKREHLWGVAYLWLAVGLFEALYGMVEYLNGTHRIWWWKNPFAEGVTGTFINRDHLAGYMEMAFLVSLSIFLARRHTLLGRGIRLRFRAKLARLAREDNWSKNLLILFFCVLIGTALLLSLSRGGTMATVVVILPISVLLALRRGTRWYGWAGICVSVLTVLYASPLGLEGLLARFESISKDVKARQELWSATAMMARTYPLVGIGGGALEWAFPAFKPPIFDDLVVTHAHNDWLEIIAETGVIGFGLISGAFASYIIGGVLAWRSRRDRVATWLGFGALSAVVAVGAHSLGEFLLRTQANAFTLAALMGWGWVVLHHHKRHHGREVIRWDVLRLPMRRTTAAVLLFCLCVFHVWVGARMGLHLTSEALVPTERNSTIHITPTRDLKRLALGIRLEPSNAARWAMMAEEVLGRGVPPWMKQWARQVGLKPEQDEEDPVLWAREILMRAIEENPTSAQLYGKLGWVLASRKSWRLEGLAERALRISLSLDPSSGIRHYQLGHYLLMDGRFQEARKAFDRAVSLSPALRPMVTAQWALRGKIHF